MNRQEVTQYIQNEFGVEEEHLWMTFPDYIVFRNQKNKKWFTIIMNIDRSKLGLDSDDRVGDEELKDLIHLSYEIIEKKK